MRRRTRKRLRVLKRFLLFCFRNLMPIRTTQTDSVMQKEKFRIALTSVIAAVFLTSIKLIAGLLTGSLGILSEAAHSGLDLLAAIMTMFAVRIADRPPDEDHHYGHGKIENLSALAETLLLVITCAWILYEAYHRLVSKTVEIDLTIWSFAVIVTSIIIDYSRSRALRRVAVKYNSQALEADAIHFQTDIWSSMVVIIGLIFVALDLPQGDAIAASIVACIVLYVSFRLGKKTIDVLLDRSPKGMESQVKSVVQSVPGVEEVRSVRLRQSGAQAFIDVVIGIRRTTSFDTAHEIMDAVESAIETAIPRAEAMVHSEPMIGQHERLSDSISWLVSQFQLTPHNVSILRIDGKLFIDLDIEYPPGSTFASAHASASDIETKIRKEIPNVGEVSIHLEEELIWSGESIDRTGKEIILVEKIRDALMRIPEVKKSDGITCFEGERGLKVNLTCSLDSKLDLKDVHDVVNNIELAISQLDARITKVFVHAEPEEG